MPESLGRPRSASRTAANSFSTVHADCHGLTNRTMSSVKCRDKLPSFGHLLFFKFVYFYVLCLKTWHGH